LGVEVGRWKLDWWGIDGEEERGVGRERFLKCNIDGLLNNIHYLYYSWHQTTLADSHQDMCRPCSCRWHHPYSDTHHYSHHWCPPSSLLDTLVGKQVIGVLYL